jgi:uncharacterized protein (DUF3820 family)
MTESVVPFGKYRGRPVDEMLADNGYMEWLGAQPWFRERFGHLLEAHDRSEAEATPIHNRLQALFLDPAYQAAFAQIVAGDRISAAIEKENDHREKVLARIRDLIEKEKAAASKGPLPPHLSFGPATDHQARIAEGEAALTAFGDLPPPAAITTVAFEAPQDVVLSISLPSADASSSGSYGLRLDGIRVSTYHDPQSPLAVLRIEIKPVIGDDYPVVLRQMMRNGSKCLFIGRYEGAGVTEGQFVAMFKASGGRHPARRRLIAG